MHVKSLSAWKKSFADSGAGFAVCLIATANPKISEAEIGIAKAKETVADGIIGVSGGSAMNLLCMVFYLSSGVKPQNENS